MAVEKGYGEQTSLYSGFRVFFLICVLFLAFFPMSGFRTLQMKYRYLWWTFCVTKHLSGMTLLAINLWRRLNSQLFSGIISNYINNLFKIWYKETCLPVFLWEDRQWWQVLSKVGLWTWKVLAKVKICWASHVITF